MGPVAAAPPALLDNNLYQLNAYVNHPLPQHPPTPLLAPSSSSVSLTSSPPASSSTMTPTMTTTTTTMMMNSLQDTSFDPLLVQDPLDVGNNVGRNVFRIHQIQRAWTDALGCVLTGGGFPIRTSAWGNGVNNSNTTNSAGR